MTAMRGGIDLGGTKIQAAVVDDDGKVHGESRHPTPTEGAPADVAAAMAEAMREAASAAKVKTKDLEGVGVGSPGVVDDAAGTVAGAGNLPHWDAPFALKDALAEALGSPVHLGNDVQVATDAEVALGAGRPYSSLLGVFWGTGVGGGIVLDGKPWLGRSAAGEIGHVVVKIGGRRCPCGRKGCMEAYAGRGAMERRARKLRGEGRAHRAVQDHGEAWPRAAVQRGLGAGAEGRRRHGRRRCWTRRSRPWAPAWPRRSTCWTWRPWSSAAAWACGWASPTWAGSRRP